MASQLEMGVVATANPIAMAQPAAPAEASAAPAAFEGRGEGRREPMSLRRAVLVSAGTLFVLGAFVAMGSASVAQEDGPKALNSACSGDSSKQCVGTQAACPGDTRGPRGTVHCNHDPTHRVCAVIGDPGTSFWSFTGQSRWCDKDLYGSGEKACPYTSDPNDADDGSWCICKWATARWIKGVWPESAHASTPTCPDSIQINCAATDICTTHQGLFFSYSDYGVNLGPAHECAKQKCASTWSACAAANPSFGTARL